MFKFFISMIVLISMIGICLALPPPPSLEYFSLKSFISKASTSQERIQDFFNNPLPPLTIESTKHILSHYFPQSSCESSAKELCISGSTTIKERLLAVRFFTSQVQKITLSHTLLSNEECAILTDILSSLSTCKAIELDSIQISSFQVASELCDLLVKMHNCKGPFELVIKNDPSQFGIFQRLKFKISSLKSVFQNQSIRKTEEIVLDEEEGGAFIHRQTLETKAEQLNYFGGYLRGENSSEWVLMSKFERWESLRESSKRE